MGITMAKHDIIAFVSADAVPADGWLGTLRGAIANADIVYGRQRHAPTRMNASTVSRGLRYHHFERTGNCLQSSMSCSTKGSTPPQGLGERGDDITTGIPADRNVFGL